MITLFDMLALHALRRVVEACAPDTPGWRVPGKQGCTKRDCLDRQGAMLGHCRKDDILTSQAPPPWPKPYPPRRDAYA